MSFSTRVGFETLYFYYIILCLFFCINALLLDWKKTKITKVKQKINQTKPF